MFNFVGLLVSMALIVPGFLLAITFHEFAHAFTAFCFGDDTPKRMGRLTLNPLAHIDLLGLAFLLIFRVGWAKPVVFNPSNFKHKGLYSVLTGLAGPFCNFLMALIFLYVIAYFPQNYFDPNITKTTMQILQITVYVNVMLGVFNLLPIPPLDGSHLLYALIPMRWKHLYFLFSQYSIFIFIILFSVPNVRMQFVGAIRGVKNLLEMFVI